MAVIQQQLVLLQQAVSDRVQTYLLMNRRQRFKVSFRNIVLIIQGLQLRAALSKAPFPSK
jgi:hypothetical protein